MSGRNIWSKAQKMKMQHNKDIQSLSGYGAKGRFVVILNIHTKKLKFTIYIYICNHFISTEAHVPEVGQRLRNCALVRMNLALEHLSNAAIFDCIEKVTINCAVF
jgi:hypothetical protein